MKIYYLIIGLILFLLSGCKESDQQVYGSGNYIQLTRSVIDSTFVHFSFSPNAETISVPISVEISGFAEDADHVFTLEAGAEGTTATEGVHFVLPEEKVFHAGKLIDTCWIQFKRNPDMKTTDYRVVLRLKGNDVFKIGQLEYQVAIFWVNDKMSQPEWWNSDVTYYYLGKYSDKKLLTFIKVTGVSDLEDMSDSEIRSYCLQFKYWLEAGKQAGNTVFEEDGRTEMTIPIVG